MSVGEDGCYVEKVHWARERHIGGGSCGRCYLCIDLKSNFLFAIKEVRLIFLNISVITLGDYGFCVSLFYSRLRFH